MLALALKERAEEVIWNNQLVKLLILQDCHLLLNRFSLVHIGVTQVLAPLHEEFQHLAIIEGKDNVGHPALFLTQALLSHQHTAYLVTQVLLDAPYLHITILLVGQLIDGPSCVLPIQSFSGFQGLLVQCRCDAPSH